VTFRLPSTGGLAQPRIAAHFPALPPFKQSCYCHASFIDCHITVMSSP
jgi:hypothetical protein